MSKRMPTGIVVGLAVAARVPGGRGKAGRREGLDLPEPVAPVAADAVQEQHQRPVALEGHREARRWPDERGLHLLRLGAGDFHGAPAAFEVARDVGGELLRRAADDLVALVDELFLPELGLLHDFLRVQVDARYRLARRSRS